MHGPHGQAIRLQIFARKKLDLVAEDLEAHRINVANPNIEAELKKKIQDEEEEDVNAGTGLGRWNASDVNQAIFEAIAQEAKLRDDLMFKVRDTIPTQMARLHTSMVIHSKKFHDQYIKRNYSSHCPFVKFCHYSEMFREIYVERFEAIYSRHLKLKLAVEALESSERDVTSLQSSASTYKTKAKEVSTACDDILEEIKIYTTEAEKAKSHYSSLENQRRQLEMNIDESKGNVLKHFANFDAMISEINACLSPMSKAMINEIAHLNPPPSLVACVFDMILILFHRKLEPISTILIKGRPCIKDSWLQSLEIIENFESFLLMLRGINYYQITPEQMELLQPYLSNEDFMIEKAKAVAKGSCVPLFKWIRQIESFYLNYEKVARVMNEYRDMEHQSKRLSSAIPAALQSIKQNTERIDHIRRQYDDAVARRQVQESADESREMTLRRAQDLLKGLKAVKMRWAKELMSLDIERQTLAGNSSMAAAFLTYCGIFTPAFRKSACEIYFPQSCVTGRVVCSIPFNFVRFLSEDSDLAQFRLQGLPSEEYVDESALIVTRCKMWNLLIDPHEVTAYWISRKIKHRLGIDVRVLNVYDDSFIASLQECVKFGVPTILHGVDMDIRDDIYDLFHVPLRSEGKPPYVRISGSQVAYHEQFEMFMIAASAQPRYSESFSAGLMIVNFTSQHPVLDLQLLASVLKADQRAVEIERSSLQISEAEFVVQIQDKRMYLLDLVCLLDGKILDKPEIVQQIDRIKSELQLMAKMREDNHRILAKSKPVIDGYLTIAKRARKIITCISRMIPLHNLYIFAMARYMRLIEQTMEDVPASSDIKDRVSALISVLTFRFYDFVSQGLMPQHKALWTLLLALHLDKDHVDSCEEQINILTHSLLLEVENEAAELEMEWMNPDFVAGLETFINQFPRFTKCGMNGKGLHDVIATHAKEWESWFQSENPELTMHGLEAPGCSFTSFEKLALVRNLRKDRFYPAVVEYARSILGKDVGDYCSNSMSTGSPVVLDVKNTFKITDSHTPTIIIFHSEIDVVDIIKFVAAEKGIDCKCIPLGPSQRSAAQKMLVSGLLLGNWIVFENGHFDITYISTLPTFWQKLGFVQDHFRLFITTEENIQVPRNLLRMSVLRCAGPPRTLRSTIYHAFDLMRPSFLSTLQDPAWIALVYSFVILFSLARGRLQFSNVGWSMSYNFRQSELNESLKLLEIEMMGLASKSANGKLLVPWEAIQHIVLDRGFGGSITDRHDRILLDTYVQRFIAPRILSSEFELVPSHCAPPHASQSAILRHIMELPIKDNAVIYGLTSAADHSRTTEMSDSLLNLATQIRVGRIEGDETLTSAALSFQDSQLLNSIETILMSDLPSQENWLQKHVMSQTQDNRQDAEQRKAEKAVKAYMAFLDTEITTMRHVLQSFRTLLLKCRCQLGCDFDFSPDDILILQCIRNGNVPARLESLSWSATSLASWLSQMKNRCHQLQEWSLRGSLNSYWLGGFFNPIFFIQTFRLWACCTHGWPLESTGLGLEFFVPESKDEIAAPINGLFIYGASWDSRASKLVSGLARKSIVPGPTLHLLVKRRQDAERSREILSLKIPCFKGNQRCSANYVIDAQFPSDEPPQKLILRSCAVFLDKDAFENAT